jgi:hypothetical protein
VFRAEQLVRGTITDQGATLVAVPGTAGATGYSLADGGASIVFSQIDNTNLMKVPAAGGVPTVIGPVTPRTGVQLLGVSCRETTCIMAVGPARLSPLTGTRQLAGSGPFELRSVDLVTGTATTVLSRSQVLSSPLLLASGNVVAQVGAGNGRFGTVGTPGSFQTLHLYKALVP